jgi:hypothetical protein
LDEPAKIDDAAPQEQPEFVEAHIALRVARRHLPSTEAAEKELIRLAAAGIIQTRAEFARVNGSRKENWTLPPKFWETATGSWSDGQFATEDEPASADILSLSVAARREKIEADWVWFRFDQLLHWFRIPNEPEENSTPAPTSTSHPARGIVPNPKWDWESALIDLMALAEVESLVDMFQLQTRGGQTRLESWLRGWFQDRHKNGECPSPTEVRNRARAIMRALPPV